MLHNTPVLFDVIERISCFCSTVVVVASGGGANGIDGLLNAIQTLIVRIVIIYTNFRFGHNKMAVMIFLFEFRIAEATITVNV